MRADALRFFSTALLAMTLVQQASGAASLVIMNGDQPGVGFNDPTPVAPIGGNTGTTLGQQRLNVMIRAAQIWGAQLTSGVEIEIVAAWPLLFCDATSAVLGASGGALLIANTTGQIPGYWYPIALANKLANNDLAPDQPDIVALFNPNIGQPNCLNGMPYYLGLDAATPASSINLLETVLHEFAHALGFETSTDPTNGQFCCSSLRLPNIFDRYLLDTFLGLHWDQMTPPQRSASAINAAGELVWDGANVLAAVTSVLGPAAEIQATSSIGENATFLAGPSQFGAPLGVPVTGELMPVSELACAPLPPLDAAAVNGKIALINPGQCASVTKVRNAQAAGARGVILVNNTTSAPPSNVNGIDPTIAIKVAMVTPQDANILRNFLRFRSRTSSGVVVRLGQSATRLAGADSANRPIMFAPAPVQPGSSVSHWDVSAFPNLLMEPFDTPETTLSVGPPADLTLPQLLDIGWN
jgi:hypothetical protein